RALLMKRVVSDGAVLPTLEQVQNHWPQARVQRVSPAVWNFANTATQQALVTASLDQMRASPAPGSALRRVAEPPPLAQAPAAAAPALSQQAGESLTTQPSHDYAAMAP